MILLKNHSIMLMSSEDTSKLFTKVNTKFKCDSSVKSFTQAGNLRVGIKTVHEGQSDYKCDSCDQRSDLSQM